MASLVSQLGEEQAIRNLIQEVELPLGVKLKEIRFGVDHTGDEAVWIVFSVAKRLELSQNFLRRLHEISGQVTDRIHGLQMAYLPYVRFVEGGK